MSHKRLLYLYRSFVFSILSLTLSSLLGCSYFHPPAGQTLSSVRSRPEISEPRRITDPEFRGSLQKELTGWDTRRHLGGELYLNDVTHHSFQFVEDKWSDDNYAGRFEIRSSDQQINGGWRSEFKDKFTAMPGDRVRYSFDFLLPRNFVLREPSVVIAQWHDKKTDGAPAQRPQLSLRIVCGTLHLYLWNDEAWDFSCARGSCGNGPGFLLSSRVLTREQWHRADFDIIWSAEADGRIFFSLDGRKVIDYHGPTTYGADSFGPYFKLGLYTVHSFAEPLVAYYKRYRRIILSPPVSGEQ